MTARRGAGVEAPHGTLARYTRGHCRCDTCRTAKCRCEKMRRLAIVEGRPRLTSSVGVARRLQALSAIGWTTESLAEHLGISGQRGRQLRAGSYSLARVAAAGRVCDLYDDLSMTIGPSERARKYALARGWYPPLAWDDDTIDDPDAQPHAGRTQDLHLRGDLIEDIDFLMSTGMTHPEAIANRLGRSLSAAAIACRRGGRCDLANLFEPQQKRDRPRRRAARAEAVGVAA